MILGPICQKSVLGNAFVERVATEFVKRDRVLMTGRCLSEDSVAAGVVCGLNYLKFAG